MECLEREHNTRHKTQDTEHKVHYAVFPECIAYRTQ